MVESQPISVRGCPLCGSLQLREDLPEITCSNCGCVIGARLVNPKYPFLVGSTLPPKNKIPIRLRGYVQSYDIWRKDYWRARDAGVPEALLARAAHVYQKVSKNKALALTTNWRHTLALCCIYLAAREHHFCLPEAWFRYLPRTKSSRYVHHRKFMFMLLPYFTSKARTSNYVPSNILIYRFLQAHPHMHLTSGPIASAIGMANNTVSSTLGDALEAGRLNAHVRYGPRHIAGGKTCLYQREYWWEP